jgi:hypothetical protein
MFNANLTRRKITSSLRDKYVWCAADPGPSCRSVVEIVPEEETGGSLNNSSTFLCGKFHMARTRGRRRAPQRPPLEEYNSLEHHKRLICWYYYRGIVTGGREGFNPTEVGSVFHYRTSAYLQSKGRESWFRHLARQMVTLAQRFAEINQEPPKPLIPGEQQQQQQPQQQQQQPTASIPTLPDLSQPRRNMARSPAPATPIRAAPSPQQLASSEEQGLQVPTCSGSFTKFNYTTRRQTTHVMIRMIVHSAVTKQDVEFEWFTPRKLKVRVAWPEWFLYAEQMAAFTIDKDGSVVFPPEHALTMSTANNNQELVEEDGRVWDEGIINFDQDMKTDGDDIFELLDVKIPSTSRVVIVLQMLVE